jgi:phage terminase Nu1 subunit (DNA packaging protein)
VARAVRDGVGEQSYREVEFHGVPPPTRCRRANISKMNGTVTTAALAELFGVTDRTIRDLAKRSIIVRAGMLAVPSRCAQRLPHLSAHDVAEIDREVRDVLIEIGE